MRQEIEIRTEAVAAPPTAVVDTGALNALRLEGRVAVYRPGSILFAQGALADTVLHIQSGRVKLSLTSATGKEGIVGVLGDGDFCGERALTEEPVHVTSATAMDVCRIRIIPRRRMIRLLHEQHAFAEFYLSRMLVRNCRLEADLVDQLLHSCEQRLARTLLVLAGYDHEQQKGPRVLRPIPQEILAEMVGTTRSRVNFFMNTFRKRGLIEYGPKGITVHDRLRGLLS